MVFIFEPKGSPNMLHKIQMIKQPKSDNVTLIYLEVTLLHY